MTSEAVRKTDHWAWIAGFLACQVFLIVTDRWWPGSLAHTLARIAFFGSAAIWLGLMMAIDWIEKGEPSEQFTRTRWFQRHSRRQSNT